MGIEAVAAKSLSRREIFSYLLEHERDRHLGDVPAPDFSSLEALSKQAGNMYDYGFGMDFSEDTEAFLTEHGFKVEREGYTVDMNNPLHTAIDEFDACLRDQTWWEESRREALETLHYSNAIRMTESAEELWGLLGSRTARDLLKLLNDEGDELNLTLAEFREMVKQILVAKAKQP